jgi:hypothetical protein
MVEERWYLGFGERGEGGGAETERRGRRWEREGVRRER